MNRETWKLYYRILRIARREAYKVATDALLYGTGYMMCTGDLNNPCYHIDLREIVS